MPINLAYQAFRASSTSWRELGLCVRMPNYMTLLAVRYCVSRPSNGLPTGVNTHLRRMPLADMPHFIFLCFPTKIYFRDELDARNLPQQPPYLDIGIDVPARVWSIVIDPGDHHVCRDWLVGISRQHQA